MLQTLQSNNYRFTRSTDQELPCCCSCFTEEDNDPLFPIAQMSRLFFTVSSALVGKKKINDHFNDSGASKGFFNKQSEFKSYERVKYHPVYISSDMSRIFCKGTVNISFLTENYF